MTTERDERVLKKMRAVVIGLGGGAERIMLPALKAHPQVEIVAASDASTAACDQAAKRWQIPQTFVDPSEMLQTIKPDITAIATPPLTHYELSLLALKHGSHVYCEKPFMPSLAEADRVIALAQQQQLCIGVNSQYYQMPIYRHVQTLIEQASHGRLYHIDAWQQMYLLPHEEGGWKAALQPRRVLFEFGTHAIDLICRYFGAYPQAVTARIAQVRADVEADVCINVRLDFPGNRMANLMFNRMSYAPLRYFEMRLNFEKSAVRTSLGGVAGFDAGWNSERGRPRLRFSFTKGGEARLEKAGDSQLLINQPDMTFGGAAAAHFATFVAAIQQDRPAAERDIVHARKILGVMLACYESAENGGELVRL